MRWRWDQGRLDYFKYDNIVLVARVLCDLAGLQLRARGEDPLRSELCARTGLPFAPSHYRVWRNYGRVFSCALLATSIDNRLAVTDICKKVAGGADEFSVDDYISLFAQRFSYPFPAFQGYNAREGQVFPICAVLKMLLARCATERDASISLNEVFSYVIGNDCRGDEDIEHYITLSATGRTPQGDEQRQVRELLIFCSQLNSLKWHNNTLFLDLDSKDQESVSSVLQLATPFPIERCDSPNAQLIHLGTVPDQESLVVPTHTRDDPADIVFTEGRRIRVTHLRSERSPRLRKIYFEVKSPPFLCDMCTINLAERYPWTDNILELHHLLPLRSALSIDTSGTSLNDVEPLCPNCHKSIHVFYAGFLRSSSREDFECKEEARRVYSDAKRLVAS